MIDEKKLIEDLKESGMIADNEYGNAMVDFIENQPKVGEWIPCSERLPDEPDNTTDYPNDDIVTGRVKKYTVTIEDAVKATNLYYLGNGKWYDNVYGGIYDNVLAWQPQIMPDAYKV